MERGEQRVLWPQVTILQQQKYLELYLVADFRMVRGVGGRGLGPRQPLTHVPPFQYEKQQRDEKAVKTRIFDIVNFVNMVRLKLGGGG